MGPDTYNRLEVAPHLPGSPNSRSDPIRSSYFFADFSLMSILIRLAYRGIISAIMAICKTTCLGRLNLPS
jgi:hypothetical protein